MVTFDGLQDQLLATVVQQVKLSNINKKFKNTKNSFLAENLLLFRSFPQNEDFVKKDFENNAKTGYIQLEKYSFFTSLV